MENVPSQTSGRLPRLSDAALAEVLPWLEAAKDSLKRTQAYHRAGINLDYSETHINGLLYATESIRCINWLVSVANMHGKRKVGTDAGVQQSGSTGD